jgi:hypothetical protein
MTLRDEIKSHITEELRDERYVYGTGDADRAADAILALIRERFEHDLVFQVRIGPGLHGAFDLSPDEVRMLAVHRFDRLIGAPDEPHRV